MSTGDYVPCRPMLCEYGRPLVGNWPERIFMPQGWECPKCGRVYAPAMIMCPYCGKDQKEVAGTTDIDDPPHFTTTNET